MVDLGNDVALGSVDGLELQGRTLYAVRNTNQVTVVRLGSQLAAGTVLGDITTEAINLIIEKVRRLAHGFKDFDRLRIMLAVDGRQPYRTPPTHA